MTPGDSIISSAAFKLIYSEASASGERFILFYFFSHFLFESEFKILIPSLGYNSGGVGRVFPELTPEYVAVSGFLILSIYTFLAIVTF
jgi:hypothetical protein